MGNIETNFLFDAYISHLTFQFTLILENCCIVFSFCITILPTLASLVAKGISAAVQS